MKKIFVFVIIIVCILFIACYLFFPKTIISSNTKILNCTQGSFTRYFMDENKWQKWWPGSVTKDAETGGNVFHHKNFEYRVTGKKYNTIFVQARGNELTINETVFIIPVNNDTNQIEWNYSLGTNSNPVNRINLFVQTKKINNDVEDILNHIKTFFEKQETVYGLTINQVQVKDTILISTKFSSSSYPSMRRIYEVIDSIKNYIAINNAKETDYPMLHVWQDSGLFHTAIAIPVNERITENKTFYIKRMVPGKILVSSVKGGAATADEALNQLTLFVNDNHLSSPAIPFESFVTDRMQEKDTAKWVTKIYYPIF